MWQQAAAGGLQQRPQQGIGQLGQEQEHWQGVSKPAGRLAGWLAYQC